MEGNGSGKGRDSSAANSGTMSDEGQAILRQGPLKFAELLRRRIVPVQLQRPLEADRSRDTGHCSDSRANSGTPGGYAARPLRALSALAPGVICQCPLRRSAAPPAPGHPVLWAQRSWSRVTSGSRPTRGVSPLVAGRLQATLGAALPENAVHQHWRRTPLERLRAQVVAREEALYQSIGGGADHDRIGCGEPCSRAARFGVSPSASCSYRAAGSHLTHYHQASVDTQAHG